MRETSNFIVIEGAGDDSVSEIVVNEVGGLWGGLVESRRGGS